MSSAVAASWVRLRGSEVTDPAVIDLVETDPAEKLVFVGVFSDAVNHDSDDDELS